MIVLIDNYDSFTYNLVQYLGEVDGGTCEIRVIRNDAISVAGIRSLRPSHVVISPGPCTPNEAGISLELIRQMASTVPLLGVCLGHQAIGQAFGGSVVRAENPRHGKTSTLTHSGRSLFRDLPRTFQVARYHSLVVDPGSLPECLDVTARAADDGVILAVEHRHWPWCVGLQFHPESIATEHGKELLRRFLALDVTSVRTSCVAPHAVADAAC